MRLWRVWIERRKKASKQLKNTMILIEILKYIYMSMIAHFGAVKAQKKKRSIVEWRETKMLKTTPFTRRTHKSAQREQCDREGEMTNEQSGQKRNIA